MDTHPKTAHLFGYPVHLVSNSQARSVVAQALERKENLQVVTLNPEMIMQADQNPPLERILKTAGLILPDGAGLVWALRKRGHQDVARLPGIEFSEGLLQWAAETSHKVSIIGAAPDVLDMAIQALQQRYRNLNIVYSHHGYFKSDEEAAIAQACAAAQPDIVLVALGVPRQETWIDQYRSLFHGTVFVGVGGSLDVWSGKTQRAPSLMRRMNLEWMYRITTEPWRIKRTYKTLPLFVVKVLMSRGNA